MSDLFWKPQEELIRQSWAFAQESRIGRFLGFSTALHFMFAALSPWLLLSFTMTSEEERLVIRMVDFVLPPETAPISEKRETKGGGGGGPVKPEKIARPVRRPPPMAKRQSSEPPAPPAARKVADVPGPREVAAAVTPAREQAPAPVEPAEVPVAARSSPAADDVKALAESLTQAPDRPTRPTRLAPETRQARRLGPRAIAPTLTPAHQGGPVQVEASEAPVPVRSGFDVEAVKALAESLTQASDLQTRPTQLAPETQRARQAGPRAIAPTLTPAGETGPVHVEPSQGPVPAGSGSDVEAAKTLAESLSEAGDFSTLPSGVPSAPIPAAAGPKAVGGSTIPAGTSRTGPARVTGPSSQVAGGGGRGGGRVGKAGQVVALGRELSGGAGGGPIATVAIPRGLVEEGAGRGGVGSGGGMGTGVGQGVGSGGGASIGPGAGLVDTRDPDFSDYFRVIEKRVRAVWKYPEGLEGSTQTVKLRFSLRLDGSLRDVRVVSSTSGTLNVSALAAMKRASPLPPLPVKFHALAGQPLVMSFTVTIK
ncbi:MAG: TonB family protein [Candidatus Methylomirabilia bacterium]